MTDNYHLFTCICGIYWGIFDVFSITLDAQFRIDPYLVDHITYAFVLIPLCCLKFISLFSSCFVLVNHVKSIISGDCV